MPALKIESVRNAKVSAETHRSFEGLFEYSDVGQYELETSRGAEGTSHQQAIKPGDVVQLELADGMTLYLQPDNALALFEPGGERGTTQRDRALGARLSLPGEQSRGLLDLAVKAIRFLRPKSMGPLGKEDLSPIDNIIERAVGAAAEKTAAAVAARIESALEKSLHRPEGLYECGWVPLAEDGDDKPKGHSAAVFEPGRRDGEFSHDRLQFGLAAEHYQDRLSATEPSLVLIHGTASSTQGSFGGLASPGNVDLIEALRRRYGSRIFAYQHRTLSRNPIQNAIGLLRYLPVGARIHLVTHSRGGLVGELLGRAMVSGEPFDLARASDLFHARRAGHKPELVAAEVDQLRELNDLLKEKRPEVERFVRVGCPSRGTILASERLDLYLSILLELVTALPFLDNILGDFLKALVLKTAEMRTRPEELPGLEAQMPTSPLVHLVNVGASEVNADLAVIAGDVRGDGLWRRLRAFASYLYYWEQNDLVVNTRYMYGGAPRKGITWHFFDEAPDVDHFSYFRNRKSARRLIDALGDRPDEGPPPGFKEISKGLYEGVEKSERGKTEDVALPIVFVLPGIMGSHLDVAGDRVWIDVEELAFGGLAQLSMQAAGVRASGLVGNSYSRLVEHLSHTHEVIPFPYDWRRSVREEARRLAASIAERLQASDQPIRIVAHSMGGLVSRAMQFEAPETWQRLVNRAGFRFVMLGTPSGGSYSIVRTLVGHEKLLQYLAVLDVKHDRRRLIELISSFTGILELLPAEAADSWYDAATWKKLASQARDEDHLVIPDPSALRDAASLHTLFEQHPLHVPETAGKIFYVAGQAERTPVGIAIVGDELEFKATARGDGRVPWDTGIPDGIDAWYAPVSHGDLVKYEEGFEAYVDLLNLGKTGRLPQTSPADVSRGDATSLRREETRTAFPDLRELEAAALGAETEIESVSGVSESIRVTVCHGNLTFAHNPITVGHYEGDTLVGPEAAIDACLGGALTRSKALGLYPGRQGTAECFRNRAGQTPTGALVIGLGQVGKLSPGRLREVFTHGVLTHVSRLRESPSASESARLTTVLIGSGAGGLGIRGCIRAMLRGVFDANRLLREQPTFDGTVIEHLEFIELYEDRAVEAVHALDKIQQHDEFFKNNFEIYSEDFRAYPLLQIGQGGRKRVFEGEDDSWWRRLEIRKCDDDEGLVFTALTDTARATVRMQPTQRGLIDSFVKDAVASTTWNRADASTLFELLIPADLKEYSIDEHDLVLVVDKHSAAYPWELMHDRKHGKDKKPVAVRTGVVRQLATELDALKPTYATEPRIVIVGNPKLGRDSKFAPLQGAQAEAHAVRKKFRQHGFETVASIQQSAKHVINTIFEGDCRILHLAGHGEYRAASGDEPEMAGVVLDNGHFTANEIGQMRPVPELVFVNCCHLGRIDDTQFNKLAASIAITLIEKGVKAVVAAGWAVADGAAKQFALSFYDCLLTGDTFGEAVKKARAKTYDWNNNINTWGAYQCYGDPAYRLVQHSGSRDGGMPRFASLSEATTDLYNAAADAKAAKGDGIAGISARVDAIVGPAPPEWAERAEFQAAAGLAYGELGRYGEAVASLSLAVKHQSGQVRIKDLERLSSFKAKWAVELAAMSPAKRRELGAATPARLISEAVRDLTRLNQHRGETVTRLCLIAACHKRRIQVGGSRSVVANALRSMVDEYYRAHKLAIDTTGKMNHYPALNWATGELLRSWRDARIRPDRQGIDEVLSAMDAQIKAHAGDTSFWRTSVKPDCLLVRKLLPDSPAAGVDYAEEIAEAYLKGHGSPREFRSVIENLEFVVGVLNGAKGEKARQLAGRLSATLAKVKQVLAD